ncbi:MAG: DNA mismatch endonuclease Vsr [Geobacteraceae bacterium]|nr:DNA mismatch endonuclease Vsr [Geobacteraceae bacterium]
MTDIVDKETRSRMMSGIRGKDTKPEYHIRRILHRNGFRYRLHVKDLPGKPDIVLPRYHAVILVSGCFWHGHDCHLFRIPTTRMEFWTTKIDHNRANDRLVLDSLQGSGWRVATVWECALRGKHRMDDSVIVSRLSDWIRSSEKSFYLAGTPPTV